MYKPGAGTPKWNAAIIIVSSNACDFYGALKLTKDSKK